MKSYRKELCFETPSGRAFINITGQVQKFLSESGIKEGGTCKYNTHLIYTIIGYTNTW